MIHLGFVWFFLFIKCHSMLIVLDFFVVIRMLIKKLYGRQSNRLSQLLLCYMLFIYYLNSKIL